MGTVQDVMDRAKRMIEMNRAQATGTNAIYKFMLSGEGGGTFVVNLTDNPGVTEGDGDAQCTIKMAVEDFVEMVEGRVDSRELFFTGRLSVDGDMSLAMKLRKLRESVANQTGV